MYGFFLDDNHTSRRARVYRVLGRATLMGNADYAATARFVHAIRTTTLLANLTQYFVQHTAMIRPRVYLYIFAIVRVVWWCAPNTCARREHIARAKTGAIVQCAFRSELIHSRSADNNAHRGRRRGAHMRAPRRHRARLWCGILYWRPSLASARVQ